MSSMITPAVPEGQRSQSAQDGKLTDDQPLRNGRRASADF